MKANRSFGITINALNDIDDADYCFIIIWL